MLICSKEKYFECYYLTSSLLKLGKKYKSKESFKVSASAEELLTHINCNSHIYKVKAHLNLKSIIPSQLYILLNILDYDNEIVKKVQYYETKLINSIVYLKSGKKNNYNENYAVSIYDKNGKLSCQESYIDNVLNNFDGLPAMVIYENDKVKEMRYYKNGFLTEENGCKIVKF
jgi:hypothetical protein